MPSGTQDGRRAAQATAAPMENDQEERNACLRKVQARDLVEFGMIPVCFFFSNQININLQYINICTGICRSFPGASSFPQSGRRYARPDSHTAKERTGSAVQSPARHGPGGPYVQRGCIGRNRQTRHGTANGSPWTSIDFGEFIVGYQQYLHASVRGETCK